MISIKKNWTISTSIPWIEPFAPNGFVLRILFDWQQ